MAGTPELNLLPLFVAVADAGSMSAAARTLGWPKSSVSRGIAALEASLEVQLFHRTTRKVSLTTAGEAFAEKARPLVASFRELTQSLPEQEQEPSGELRITMPVDIAQTFLVDVAAQFSLRYPQVQLDVRPSDRVVDLVADGFDAALRIGTRLPASTLVARKLGVIEMALYASPSYLSRRGTPRSTDELAGHDWVTMRGQPSPLGLPRVKTSRLTTDDFVFARGAVVAGVGLGVLPSFLVGPDVMSGRVDRVLRWSASAGNLFFVHPPAPRPPRKVTAFRDFLLSFLARRPLA